MTAEELVRQMDSGVEDEEDFDYSGDYQDPDYKQDPRDLLYSSSENKVPLEENFMSGKGRGVKRKKGAGGG